MKIAFLITNDFEDVEFRKPYDALQAAGFDAVVLGVEKGMNVTGKKRIETITIEESVADVSAKDFDAVIIPGGYSPDKLRLFNPAVNFIRRMNEEKKLIAAVCHGSLLMISAEIVKGRTLTSWPSIAIDLRNAGVQWVDRPVVIDYNFVTSRNPGDLEIFSQTIITRLEELKAA